MMRITKAKGGCDTYADEYMFDKDQRLTSTRPKPSILAIRFSYSFLYMLYTEYAGLEMSVFLCIASFSQQIVNGNAGPSSALESMGTKRHFRCNFCNIGLIYK